MMPITEISLPSGEARNIEEAHEAIRRAAEEQLRGLWRVTRLARNSVTTYGATLSTRTTTTPDYIASSVVASYIIDFIENGPLDRRVNGEIIAIPRKKLHCKAELLSSGKLRITQKTIEIPSKT